MTRLSRRGPIGMEARGTFTDVFNRANQTPVANPPYLGNSTATCNLSSNTLVMPAAFAAALTPTTSADADVSVTGILNVSAASIDALSRLTAARSEGQDCVLFSVAASSWSLTEFVSGTSFNLGSGTNSPVLNVSNPNTVRLVCSGTTCSAYINGVLATTATLHARAQGVWYHGLRGNSNVSTVFTGLTIVSNGTLASP